MDALGGCLSAGITPAHAGKRCGCSRRLPERRDHPRACGEKSKVARLMMGSPPRVRGKVVASEELPGVVGITPAYAGKSSTCAPCPADTWDHPRVCGEKTMRFIIASTVSGSPPRMRGKVSAGKILLHDGGITPACAGKSLWCAQGQAQERDHPRVCEEKNFLLLMTSRRSGSPPRVRGKVDALSDIIQDYGITPACAGKSHWESLRRSPPEDHPRVCGEKDKSRVKVIPSQGSPPRVRGKAKNWFQLPPEFRITPACAGKSDAVGGRRYSRQDHPRVCGEKAFTSKVARRMMGSPPRVRGKGPEYEHRDQRVGITPACAGKRAGNL